VSRTLNLVIGDNLNTTPSSQSLHNALTDPIQDLYTSNTSAPLQTGAGLRQVYEFGLYSHCGYIGNQGICTNHTAGRQFKPYDAITSDMAANYTRITEAVLAGTTFENSHYLGQSSQAAYWMLLLGTLCAFLALLSLVLPARSLISQTEPYPVAS
jgi:SUR7/PalI family